MRKTFDRIDRSIAGWMRKNGFLFLRIALGVVFIWFGILKPLGISPAEELVTRTVYWFSPTWFVPFLGWWEVVIGLCFLYKPLLRLGIFLLMVQMAGTFLPFLLHPEVVFTKNPLALTLEGEFIIKNLVLISAAIVVGSTVRGKKGRNA